jgi:uncharacterized protein (DUF488 family)
MRVYTLGTDHRKQFDFTRLLGKYGIQVIFDVRRTPEAQEEYFRRDGLQQLCAGQHVDYVYLGNELGGPGRGSLREWTGSEGFARGLSIIGRKAASRVCCILCSERSPESCHRRTVGDRLAGSGIDIVHIIDDNEVWRPSAAVDSSPHRPASAGRRRQR